MPYIYNAGYFLYDCHNLEELYIPDEYNYLDYYDEIPEQEALELQEKYNNNGDRNIN